MSSNPSFFRDLKDILFSSSQFFADRFFRLDSKRIFWLGYVGVLVGYLVGSVLNYGFSELVLQEFARSGEQFAPILEKLNLDAASFVELLNIQRAYHLLIAVFSPLIAYCAIHLFGGALFGFLWLMARPKDMTYARVMECATLALSALIFNAVPVVGSLIAVIMLVVIASRALKAQYQLMGFFKVMAILSTVYICFFLSSATLQLVAPHLAKALGW